MDSQNVASDVSGGDKRKRKHETLNDFLLRANTLLIQARKPEIASAMEKRGFPAADCTSCLKQIDEVRRLSQVQQLKIAERLQDTSDFNQEVQAVRNRFLQHVKLSRIVFGKDQVAFKALGLSGVHNKGKAYDPAQAMQFYSAVLGSKSWLKALAQIGINSKELETTRDAMGALVERHKMHLDKSAESREATRVRNERYTALKQWVSRFAKIAGIVFHDEPALLAQLSLR